MSIEIHCHDGEPRYRDMAIGWGTRDGYRDCNYCGSIHPEDLLSILTSEDPRIEEYHQKQERFYQSLAAPMEYTRKRLELADMKYGYPHKFYVNGIVDPLYGQPKVSSTTSWTDENEQRQEKSEYRTADFVTGKFYTKHLLDLVDDEGNGNELFEKVTEAIRKDSGLQIIPWLCEYGKTLFFLGGRKEAAVTKEEFKKMLEKQEASS